MTLAPVEIQMPRGDAKLMQAMVTYAGLVYDPTGKKLLFTVKRSFADPDSEAVIQLSSTDDRLSVVTITGGAKVVQWEILPADFDGWQPGPLAKEVQLVWDLQMTLDSTHAYTIAVGTLRIKPDVTITI